MLAPYPLRDTAGIAQQIVSYRDTKKAGGSFNQSGSGQRKN